MWRLFFPLRYFSLVNNEKRHIDVLPTLLFGVLLAAPFVLIPDASFFRSGGFLDKILTLTSALTGFYVAALVAAATFPREELDKVIAIGSIALPMKVDGKRVMINLTRREFACTIFGYLAFSALMLSIFAGFFIALSPVRHELISFLPWQRVVASAIGVRVIHGIFVFIFCAAIAHLAVATSLGLYYLMDRLNRREPEVLTEKPNKRVA